jgi:hypothetical protein
VPPGRPIVSGAGAPAIAPGRVAPFGLGRLIARLQLPVHVSPLSASFFGRWPLGILPAPLLAWHALSAVCAFAQATGVVRLPLGSRFDPLVRFGKIEANTHYVVVKVLTAARLDN